MTEHETSGPAHEVELRAWQVGCCQPVCMGGVRVRHAPVWHMPLGDHPQAVGEQLETIERGGGGLHTVEREHLADRTEARARTGNPLPQVPVLTGTERGVEAPDRLDE